MQIPVPGRFPVVETRNIESPNAPFWAAWRLGAGLCCALLLAWGCKKAPGPELRGPPEVQVTTAVQRDVPVYQVWIGNLDGSVNTQVRPRVSGYLIAQNYQDGARVKEGELLFQIDPRPLQAALDQARGDLARAEAAEKLAALNLKRAKELFAGKVTSVQERDTSVADYGTAKANVQAQQAAVETARLNLDYAQITSPVDGIAGIATAQIGDFVGPEAALTTALTTISSVDPIKAYVTITEQDYIEFARRLAQGDPHRKAEQSLEMVLADGSIYPQKGTFYFADRQVDVTTGAMRVAALFSNKDGLLRPGLFCRVRAQTALRMGAVLVPEQAVSELQGSSLVAVVGRDRKVALRKVELGEREPPWRVVRNGVSAGETVVVEGIQKVRDGMEVAATPWKQAPP